MRIIAHRGFSGLRVENTLAAFALAIECGAAGAELDVHLSRDGEVVVHHDDNLNPAYCRRPDGAWITPAEAVPLRQLTLAELQRYDIGTPDPQSAYARRFPDLKPAPGQRIPRLREVIDLVQAHSRDFRLVIEIKSPPLAAAARPWQRLLESTLAVLAAKDFFARATLCSFDWGALVRAQLLHPGIATWYTSVPMSWLAEARPPASEIPPDEAERQALRTAHLGGQAPWYAGFAPQQYGGDRARAVAAAGGSAWFPWHRDYNVRSARQTAAAGITAAAWSVNLRDAAEQTRLANSGLPWLVADYPEGGA